MGHQGILIAVGIVPPGRFTEPVYGDDAALVAVEDAEQLKFFGSQRLPVPRLLMDNRRTSALAKSISQAASRTLGVSSL